MYSLTENTEKKDNKHNRNKNTHTRNLPYRSLIQASKNVFCIFQFIGIHGALESRDSPSDELLPATLWSSGTRGELSVV